MNCKPGDLAIVVRSRAGNEGRVLTCLRLASRAECRAEGFGWSGAVWVTDADLVCNDGTKTRLYPDDRLRPIRDNDAQDETLTWAGKPSEVMA